MRPAPTGLFERAMAAWQQGRARDAETLFRALLDREPGHGEGQHRCGLLLAQYGHPEAALEFLARAEVLLDGRADVRINFATVCQRLGRLDQALGLLEAAVASGARQRELFFNLGVVRQALGRFTDAAEAFAAARRQDPDWADPWYSEGNCLLNAGQPEIARAVLAEARRRFPSDAGIASNYLLTLNYCPTVTPSELGQAHREWGLALAGATGGRPAGRVPTRGRQRGNVRAARRRLGFLSPNLGDHAVAFFFEPLLEHLDATRYECFAYALTEGADTVGTRLKARFAHWRDVARLDDATLAQRLADDRLDVLIDLAGHTAANRLPVLANRLAPLQVSMIGYPATSGIGAIDYCLTDATLDPPAEAGHAFVENLYRLPLFCCYRPPEQGPAVGELPLLAAGAPTLGSFQSLGKLSDPTLDMWSALLLRVPAARLQLRALGAGDRRAVAHLLERFAARGVENGRIEVGGFAGFEDFLAAHHQIDLCLDTLPWNGHTTTCHALWMGVPTLTARGDRRAGRMGAALMEAVGLPALVVGRAEDFAARGAELLADAAGLAAIRAGLRDRLLASPLCDGVAYAASFSDFIEDKSGAIGKADVLA